MSLKKKMCRTVVQSGNKKGLWASTQAPALSGAPFSQMHCSPEQLFSKQSMKLPVRTPAPAPISPTGDACFFFSIFQIVPNFSQVIKYHNIL